jgi:hypothetical protein
MSVSKSETAATDSTALRQIFHELYVSNGVSLVSDGSFYLAKHRDVLFML